MSKEQPLVGAPPPQLPKRSAEAILAASQAGGFKGPTAAHAAVADPEPVGKGKAKASATPAGAPAPTAAPQE